MEKTQNLKTTMGIVLVILAIVALLFWEAEGRRLILMDEVLVASADVKIGEQISAGMFNTISVPVGTLVEKAVTPENAKSIEGKEASVSIIKGAQLSQLYLRNINESPNPPTSFFTIRHEWIYMCSSSLRRGDKVLLTSADGKNILGKYMVAYVKDGDGREVTSISSGLYSFAGSDDSDERVNTSSPIHQVEIECELKDYRRILDYCTGRIGPSLMLIRERP